MHFGAQVGKKGCGSVKLRDTCKVSRLMGGKVLLAVACAPCFACMIDLQL